MSDPSGEFADLAQDPEFLEALPLLTDVQIVDLLRGVESLRDAVVQQIDARVRSRRLATIRTTSSLP